MEDQLTTELDGLLKSQVFYCDFCKKMLVNSCWLTPENKNICDKCYKTSKKDLPNCLENVVLSNILQKMPLLCENHNLGCRAVLKHSEYQQHVEKCAFCPLKCLFPDCVWKGPTDKLMQHFSENHKKHFQQNTKKEAEFCIDCLEGQESVSILETLNGRFIARARAQLKTGKVQLMVLHQDRCEPLLERFHVTLYYLDHYKTSRYPYVPIDNVAQFMSFHPDVVTEFNIGFPMRKSITLSYKLEDARLIIPLNILPFYECSDCKKCVTKHIYECLRDHRVCKNCVDSHEYSCSTSEFRNWERFLYVFKLNLMLPIFALNYLFPCKYREQGCTYSFPSHSSHEITCDYQTVKCPISEECFFFDHHRHLLSHIEECHKSVKVIKGSDYFVSNVTTPTQCYFFIGNSIIKMNYIYETGYAGFLGWTFEDIVKEKDVRVLAQASVFTDRDEKKVTIVAVTTERFHMDRLFAQRNLHNKQARFRVKLVRETVTL